MTDWESAEKVQKNDAGEFRAMIGGAWVPVAKAQKSATGEYRVMRGETAAVPPAPTVAAKEEGFFDKLEKGTIPARIKAGTLLYPEEEKFVRQTLQSAASGPISGVVQKIAQTTGNKELSDKIAQTAKEGNFIGGLLQPEGWLTGGKAAEFIGKGSDLAAKALRSAATVAPYSALSATEAPSDSAVSDIAKQGAIGAAFGAGIPAATKLVTGTGSVLYNLIQPYLGKSGAENAAARLAGKVSANEGKTEEIANLLLKAKQGQTASEAALPAQSAEFSAIQNIVGETRPTLLAASRRAADEQARQEIAGVARTPEMMQRVIERRRMRTEPMRQTAMEAASVADTKGAQLADEIAQKRESMIQAMRGQPALLGSIEQKQPVVRGFDVKATFEGPQTEAAQSAVRFAEGKPGWLSNADRAKEWGSAADDLTQIAGQRRQEGAFKQMQLDSIRDYGMKPLDVDAIQSAIGAKMKAPGGGIGIDAKVLQGVGDEIARIKALKGRVYPEDLHEIRKKGINDVIESLNTGTPGATEKRASQVAGELRNKIDEVLDEASGGLWTPYLKSFQRLSRMKNEMEVGQELQQALTGRFGNERIAPFGTALRNAETNIDPNTGRPMIESLYPRSKQAVQRVADQFEKERQLGELSKIGTAEALKVMRATELPGTAPGMISWKVTALNKVLNALEGTGGEKTNKALAELMLNNPQKLGELMKAKNTPVVDDIVRALLERQSAIAASQ